MAGKQRPEQAFDFDVSKYFSDFKIPGIDFASLAESQRKNFEAVTQANKVAYEGLQTVAKRQAEILRQVMEGAAKMSQDLVEPGSPQGKAAKQAELVKSSFDGALANAREITELMTKSNTEAVEVLNARFSQSLDELRDAFLKVGK